MAHSSHPGRIGTANVGSLGVDSRKLGVWTFIGSEALFFAALITTYLVFAPQDEVEGAHVNVGGQVAPGELPVSGGPQKTVYHDQRNLPRAAEVARRIERDTTWDDVDDGLGDLITAAGIRESIRAAIRSPKA